MSSTSPCAACKFLRRKCTQECVFAPYFPPEQLQKFSNIDRVYGASYVTKLLNELNVSQREKAVNSLAYEAEKRIEDPVGGCYGLILRLQTKEQELSSLLQQRQQKIFEAQQSAAMSPAREQELREQEEIVRFTGSTYHPGHGFVTATVFNQNINPSAAMSPLPIVTFDNALQNQPQEEQRQGQGQAQGQALHSQQQQQQQHRSGNEEDRSVGLSG